MSTLRTYRLAGFDDPRCTPERWQRVLRLGASDTIFLTWHWLRAWWETLGEGELLLVAAEDSGEMVAVAPLYVSQGMVFFLGVGDSDYLDFVGRAQDPRVMTVLLAAARAAAPDFQGFRFHEIPDRSGTARSLEAAAQELQLACFEEGELPSVELDLAGQGGALRDAVSRSMLKREEYCRRQGPFEVRQFRDLAEIRPQLPAYYEQHLARWQAKELPSPFADPRQRAFLERFLELIASTGWLRFLRIDWKEQPLAYEFAWYYKGTHYSARWCFDVRCANQSPGQILLRQSVLAALAEGMKTYDLGAGDQEYKLRLPGHTFPLRTWGLYPP